MFSSIIKPFLLSITISFSAALAQDNPFENWDPHFEKGDFSYSAAVGFNPWWGRTGLSITPGMEIIFRDYRIGETVPLSVGVLGKGAVFANTGNGFGDLGLTVAGLASGHIGFKNVEDPIEWLSNFDFYFGLGLSYDLLRPEWYDSGRLRFASVQGTNYFIKDNFALFAENSFLGRYRNYFSLGVLWKV